MKREVYYSPVMDETGVDAFLSLSVVSKVEKAQPRRGRRKPPPVIFASLGPSVMWMQRMFGEFIPTHTLTHTHTKLLETTVCFILLKPPDTI